MLVEEELERALGLQARALGLLKWLSENKIDVGFRHDAALDQGLVFGRWVWANRAALPRRVAPASAEHARGVGRLVASLLESSFTWQSAPGWVRFSPDAHCFCPMCSWMVERPPLQTRKVRSRDKRRAARLTQDWVEALARGAGVPAPEGRLSGPEWRETLALGTYGEQLLRRAAGTDTSGVANLALWRRFAWTPTGAPKRGFVLRASMMVAAQQRVIEHLQDAA